MAEEIIEGFRLSPQQERLWLLGREGGGAGPYCAVCVVELRGALRVESLRAALDEVAGRHEILHTVFPVLPGMTLPVQVCGEGPAPAWAERDLRGLDARAREAEVEAMAEAAARLRDPLDRGPLLHAALARLAEDEHVLVLSLPALCADRVSLDLLVEEVGRAYGEQAGEVGPAEAPFQYADLSALLNELLESEETRAGREYWLRSESAPEAGAARLAFERQPEGAGFDPRVVSVTVGEEAVRRVEAYARERGTTPAAFFLACWQTLLWRHTAQGETVVGVLHDGRGSEELERALGPLAKYLPARARPEAAASFDAVVRQADEALAEHLLWQDYFSWGLLTRPDGEGAGDSFFPFTFEFAGPAAAHTWAGVSFAAARRLAYVDRFKVGVTCVPEGACVRAEFHYDAARYEGADVLRLAGQFRRLAESAAAEQDAPPDRLDLLTDEERRTLLEVWNDTHVAFPRGKCLHHFVEAQAERTPDAAALTFEGETLSYAELDAKADALARRLRALGVGPEARVGVMMERSPELVVALLGVLKAGGAYVPLDPQYPARRLAFMLEDARVAALLTERALLDTLPAHDAVVLCLDEEAGPVEATPAAAPEQFLDEEHPAYVIYTSGSTGEPKGVVIPHRAILNRLLWMLHAFDFGARDSVLQKTAVSFDASVWELFVPLMCGARVVLARPGGHRDSRYLVEAVRDEGVTILQLVPSMLQLVVEEPGLEECRSLRRLYCGGEPLSAELVRRFESRLGAELHNLYGPTEVSIDATHWACERGGRRAAVPIGRPIANTRLYILDPYLRPVPAGVAGELYVNGAGLARGYLNRPALTAERFIPDPFSREPGERMYHTGDLARYLPDGNVEFLGRADHQVKVRGYRIELGEVEAALSRHEGVRRCVVAARDDGAGGQRIVAYLVAEAGRTPTAFELREFMQKSLPEYMVPSAFVTLDELPVTPNGKVDRRALPAPGDGAAPADRSGAAPRTPTQEIVAGLWGHLLGAERVGARDDFFELGGHSLLATQAVSRVREVFGVEVGLRALFEAPTVEGFAAEVERAMGEQEGLRAGQITPAPRDAAPPLSFAQQRLWFLHRLAPESPLHNIPVTLRFRGPLDVAALERTVNEVVRRHEVLRTRFTTAAREPVQTIDPHLRVALARLDLSGMPEAEREAESRRLAEEEARRPFDLAAGPLLRLALLRLADEEHLLLCTIHHIVSDGWSMGVLVREVAALYEAFSEGRPSPLAELPIQYADYAVWQREHLAGEALARQLSYWTGQLAGAPVLELPTDRPRQRVQSNRGAQQPLALTQELSERLRRQAREEGVTLFMLLLAAFQVTLAYFAGQRDVVVGTDVANRNRSETEGLIGFFVNQLVLRTTLRGEESFGATLGRVRETTLGAYAHQDVPFEKIVEALRPGREPGQAPLFRVKLVLQNAAFHALELPGLGLAQEYFTQQMLDLDLIVELAETGEGVRGRVLYSADLFTPETAGRIAEHFRAVLERVAERTDITVGELEQGLAARDREEQAARQKTRQEAKLRKFKSVKPVAVSLGREEVVTAAPLRPGATLPLVLEPRAPEVELVEWSAANRALLDEYLARHGAVLFRGFGVESAARLERFALTLCGELLRDNGEHRRGALTDGVYTPVFYPAGERLLWHNENSFNHAWPGRILFCCARPAERGGETPVVDSRRVYEAVEPRVREKFAARGVMYVRNYGTGAGLDWRSVFQTESRREVEEKCRAQRMSYEWKEGGVLRTSCVRPAVVRHPRTGEWTWFNQAQHWHVSCLDDATREATRRLFREEDMPRNCYYGDGGRIEDEEMAAVLAAYAGLEVAFGWRRGDVMVLDNLLAAHGRNSFEGRRELLVTMGDMLSYDDVEGAPSSAPAPLSSNP
ncbi:MAG TPA: amino acid adenylation domain-containing protein [Pyrinomonadaceae bacterium]|jgi:amino acid adenylation domain-containing protein